MRKKNGEQYTKTQLELLDTIRKVGFYPRKKAIMKFNASVFSNMIKKGAIEKTYDTNGDLGYASK